MDSQIPGEDGGNDQTGQKTLAELVYRFRNPDTRQRLEEFRIKFEADFGETDLTKRYTSTWPENEQEWLMEHYPKRFWDGLPPFVQAFMKRNMDVAHHNGNLDDMSAEAIRLYLSGGMKVKYGRGDGEWQR